MAEAQKPQPAELSEFMDFMEDEDGFDSPPMPSEKHPEGKRYRITSPSAKVGLRLNALADIVAKQAQNVPVSEVDIARLRIKDQDEREFVSQVLGSALDEMVDDGCKWEHIKRMATYAFTRFAVSKEAADLAVANGLLRGKVQAPTNRAARRAKKK